MRISDWSSDVCSSDLMKGIAQGAGLLMLLLAACDGGADKDALADAEADGAINGRIACALEGAKPFDRHCTIDEMHGGDGLILIVGRADSGYRRLQIGRAACRASVGTYM